MDLKYLFSIILLLGVILLGIKFIEQFFKTKKSNDKKRNQINESIGDALQLNSDRLEQISKDYDDLYLDFIKYKKSSEEALKEMEECASKAMEICNNIIDFDKDFDDKLELWSEMLNNPENNKEVQKQIHKHIQDDIKRKQTIVAQQNEERLRRNKRIEQHLGMV